MIMRKGKGVRISLDLHRRTWSMTWTELGPQSASDQTDDQRRHGANQTLLTVFGGRRRMSTALNNTIPMVKAWGRRHHIWGWDRTTVPLTTMSKSSRL